MIACKILGHRWSSPWPVVDGHDWRRVVGQLTICKRCGAFERDEATDADA